MSEFKKLGLNVPGSLHTAPTVAELGRVLDIKNPLIAATEANYASEFHRRLLKWIADFDASLNPSEEVGVRLVNFGQTVVFRLTDIGYWNPSLLSFNGETEDGSPVELIQHVSQISILLMKLKRKDPSKPKKPIGFRLEESDE